MPEAESTPAGTLSPTGQTWVSLVLTLHLICVALALAANYSPSQLESRVRELFAPYLTGLNFDPGGTPFYLTHADFLDVDWRVEWLEEGQDENDEDAWRIALPSTSNRLGWQRHREQSLAREFAALAGDDENPDAEPLAALIAKAIARSLRRVHQLKATELRLKRHMLQPPEAINSPEPLDRDPDSANYFDVVYRANIVEDESGIEIIKRTSAAEEATSRGVTP